MKEDKKEYWKILKKRARDIAVSNKNSIKLDKSSDSQLDIIEELKIHKIEIELQNEEILKAQSALEEEKKKYFNLFDFAPVAYICMDTKGVIKEANLTAIKMLGLSRQEVSEYLFQDCVKKVSKDDFISHLEKVLETKSFQRCELILKTRCGKNIYSHMQSYIQVDSDPTILSAIVDITESKELEIEKMFLMQQVSHNDRLASLGELASVIVHELNEPLTSILGHSQLAQNEIDPSTNTYKDFGQVISSCVYARDIIKNISEFTHLENFVLAPVDLNHVVSKAINIINFKLSTNYIKTSCNLSITTPVIRGIFVQMVQVLVNLITNSIKSINKSGGEIKISTSASGGKVQVKVEDNGCGMSETSIKKIFDPFHTEWKMKEGTGLGLSVVKRIIKRHGGEIIIESKPEIGTSISLIFNENSESLT